MGAKGWSWIAGAAVALFLTVGAVWSQIGAAQHTADNGKALLAALGGPFALTDQRGRAVTDRDFHGRVVVLFFGYTFCPDICPTDLQIVAEALDRLGPRADGVQPLFVTIDPQRDNPAQLAEFTALFSPRILGLTGTPDQVAEAAKRYRVYYARAQGGESDAYTMDHSAFFYLLDRQGRTARVLPHAVPADQLASALAELLDGKEEAGS
ncbi:SCO family protein [Azospirillum griseum]|uniref:SCO family protein n=1 Tax=Azospirillum griseum TaxID=2496639 RepID=A0A431VBN1_9PROT|nr:SCO family protein [Azospirillum griseum]RTR15866.1 SCO family protein [Azospirillum griseum]